MKSRCSRPALAAVLLAALTAVAYAGVAGNGFIALDDYDYIKENPVVRQGLSLQGLLWALTTEETSNWHPLTWLSHMLDVQLFGMDAGAHHLVSLGIHLANALLLLLLLRAITGALWRPALVAALFAVHPLHVESVAWAAERKDVLSTLFALAAALAYLGAARRGRVLRAAAPPLLFALALMAKPMPVTLPFLLLLLDWWPLGRWSPTPGAPHRAAAPAARFLPPAALWIEKAPLFLLAAASASVTLQVQRGARVPERLLPFAARGANALQSLVDYLRHTLWPGDLAVFYPHPGLSPQWWRPTLAFAGLAGISVVVCRVARRRPWFAVGWLWFLGSLAPVIGLVQVGSQAMADRYTYLTLTGVFVAAAWAAADFTKRRPVWRPPLIIGSAIGVITLAALTSRQVLLWRDSGTLFEHAMSAAGENAPIHNALGVWFTELHRYDDARSHFQAAARLSPKDAEVAFNLGTAFEALGDLQGAEAAYRRALAIRPLYALAYNNLGILLGNLGRAREAEACYREALAIDPGLPQAHFNLGAILSSHGRIDEAVAHYRTAAELDPWSTRAHTNLGTALAGQGRYEEAEPHFRAAVALDPESALAHANLGNALAALGDAGGARAELRRALALDPGAANARSALERLQDREAP